MKAHRQSTTFEITGDAVDPGDGLPAAKLQLINSYYLATAKGPEPRNLAGQDNKMVRWVTFEMVYRCTSLSAILMPAFVSMKT